MKHDSTLTPKQQSFILHYIELGNGVAAARAAGYAGNDNTLRNAASRLLTNANISKSLQEASAPALEKAQATINRVLQELAAIAFAPWKDYIKIRYDKEGNVASAKLNLTQKLAALRMLAEYLGMFNNSDKGLHIPSLALHYRPGMTEEEARQKLVAFLRNQH